MRQSKRRENAVNKLIDAFFKGSLIPGDGFYCAVGNMCGNKPEWMHANADPEKYPILASEGIKLSKSVGYSGDEMREIEIVFENTPRKYSYKAGRMTKEEEIQWQYEVLCRVFDKLCELDGVDPDEKSKEILKERKCQLEIM